MMNNRDNSGGGMVGAGQMAKLLMLTRERLRQLAKEGVIPAAVRGKYPLVATTQSVMRRLQHPPVRFNPIPNHQTFPGR